MTDTYRLCNAAGCGFHAEIDQADPDTAWDAVTDHYKTAHGMTEPDAAYFGAHHSTTTEA